MDTLLIVLGAICMIVGIVGCIVPALPGVFLAYGGLWLLQLTDRVQFSWRFMIIWGLVALVARVLDYIVPAWGTKKFGGSKKGVWGSTIGLIVGLFMGPWGIVLGPFVGAVLFEMMDNKNFNDALRSCFGSFIGLLAGTIIKLICCGLMTYQFIHALI